MKFQGLVLLLGAVLTAGTAGATPVQITLNVGATGTQTGSQTVSLSIAGEPVYSQYGTSGIFQATVDQLDGWYDIAIDYRSISGPSALTFFAYDGWAPMVNLRSLDAAGNTINGLTGTYTKLDGTPIYTNYGEGPVHFVGGTAPWSGTYNTYTFTPTSGFNEVLTGQFYIGTDPNPALGQIHPPTQFLGDQADVPEPAGWWLMAVAIPLILISKLRLRRAQA